MAKSDKSDKSDKSVIAEDYKQYIRSNLFGVLLKLFFHHCDRYHGRADQIMVDVLSSLARASFANNVDLNAFKEAIEPDLTDACNASDEQHKKQKNKQSNWHKFSRDEQIGLMMRYLLYFHVHSSKYMPRRKWKTVSDFAKKHICVEKQLQKEVMARTMYTGAELCFSKSEMRKLKEELKADARRAEKKRKTKT